MSTYTLLGQLVIIDHDVGREQVRVPLIGEFAVAKRHGLLKVLGVDGLGKFLSFSHCLHQGLSDNLVLIDSDERCLSIGSGIENCLDSLNTLEGCKESIVGYSGTTTLDVSKSGDAGVEGKSALTLIG